MIKWQDQPIRFCIELFEYENLYYLETGNQDLDYIYQNIFRFYLKQDEDYPHEYRLCMFGKNTSHIWDTKENSLEEIKEKALKKLNDEVNTDISLLQKLTGLLQQKFIAEVRREGTLIKKENPKPKGYYGFGDYDYPLPLVLSNWDFAKKSSN